MSTLIVPLVKQEWEVACDVHPGWDVDFDVVEDIYVSNGDKISTYALILHHGGNDFFHHFFVNYYYHKETKWSPNTGWHLYDEPREFTEKWKALDKGQKQAVLRTFTAATHQTHRDETHDEFIEKAEQDIKETK